MTSYWTRDREPMSARAAGAAWVLAALSAQVGLGWGAWMARVKR